VDTERAVAEGRHGCLVNSVKKGRGQKNRQSLAEAIAKHLKDDYFNE
jgi:hypothetical protein